MIEQRFNSVASPRYNRSQPNVWNVGFDSKVCLRMAIDITLLKSDSAFGQSDIAFNSKPCEKQYNVISIWQKVI